MTSALSIDRGWAWAVLVGAHVGAMLTDGYLGANGVLYIEWKDYFQSTATASSWLVSIPWLVASPISFFVGMLIWRFGVRPVSMVGAAITGLASALGSLTTDIWQLYMCNAMVGVGSVMVLSSGAIILPRYFKKRYAFANGVAILGISLGQMIFAPLIRVLITHYGWRGAMFVIGALQMNGVAACALFQPLKTDSDNTAVSRKEHSDTGVSCKSNGITESAVETASCPEGRKHGASRKYLNIFQIFSDSVAMFHLLSTWFFMMALSIILAHLPARSKKAGWSDNQSAMLMLAFAVFSMIARLFNGWFVDKGYISSAKLQQIVTFGVAVSMFLNPVSDSYIFLVIYACVTGTFIGVGTPILIVNMKFLVADSEVPAALSLLWGVTCLSCGTGPVIAGKLFDITGDYLVPFLTGGAMFLASFLLFAVVLILKRRRDKKRRAQGPLGNGVLYHRAEDGPAVQV